MKAIFISAIVAASPVGLFAQQGCDEQAVTTAQVLECAMWKAEAVDALLLELERDIGQRVSLEAREVFHEIHEALEVFRKRDCEREAASFDGGSIEPLFLLNCVASKASARVRERSVFLCGGAQATGPCPESQAYIRRLEEIGVW